MKTNSKSLSVSSVLWLVALTAATLGSTAQAEPTNAAPAQVTKATSSIMKDTEVYSMRFPGGQASVFFNFLHTNGLADHTLFAGEAGDVWIPAFTVHNVRLKEVAKSIEIMTQDKLAVDLVEVGDRSDATIWRIKFADKTVSPIKTRACGMPYFLGKDGA